MPCDTGMDGRRRGTRLPLSSETVEHMRIECGMVVAGRYRVERRLGAGGMGSVWRARDLRLGRPVAVKLAAASPASGGGTGQARRRLHREAAALAALSEPRIARVYDLVEADRELCLIMELVEGESLAALLDRRERLPAGEALGIAAQCAQALESAHRCGIVHRDVKPSNIMVGADGVKVVDFGIAALTGAIHEDTTRTLAQSLVGTAAYFAPERAFGGQAGPPADFYALGVVLYRMMAGRLPYRADGTLPMVYAHVTAVPAPMPPDVPAPAARLCMRMLDKRPEARPATAAEIIAVRDAVLAGAPAKAGAGRPYGRLAALSSAAAALICATAWLSVDQVASTGASAPPRAPPRTSAPGPATVSPVVLGPPSAQAHNPLASAPRPPSAAQPAAGTVPAQPGTPGKPGKAGEDGNGGPGKQHGDPPADGPGHGNGDHGG